jgi:hypothetical protein
VIHQRLHLFHPWQENSHDSTCSKVADDMPVMPSHWNLNEDLRVKKSKTKICRVKKIHDLGEITIKWANGDKGFNQTSLLWTFWVFHKKDFLKDIFLQHVFLNIYNSQNKLHIFKTLFE